uniref:Putative secreted protein n=1 Tax=Amblyomma sculptum TaxID=1581419 RepID=A0A1E1XUP8_AMBSC
MDTLKQGTERQRMMPMATAIIVLGLFVGVSKGDAPAAPGDFELWGVATGARSLEVVAFVPQVTNGDLDLCYGTLRGPDTEKNFTCDDHGGRSSTITLKGLKPLTEYNCTVTFANLLDGQELATTKSILITTQGEPVEPGPDIGSNRTYTGTGVAFVSTPAMPVLCAAFLSTAWQITSKLK